MSKKEIQKVVDTWITREYTTIDEFNKIHSDCVTKINQYDIEDIVQLCNQKLALVGTIETQLQLLLYSLAESNSEAAIELIWKALTNVDIEDKGTLLDNLNRFYPKEKITPLFIKAVPYIEPFDESAGHALVFALEKLIGWGTELPENVIKHALKDPAFRVQRIIIPYVIKRNMVEFKPDLYNLMDEEEIYDYELEKEVKIFLEK